jgi:hypothetical protein
MARYSRLAVPRPRVASTMVRDIKGKISGTSPRIRYV